MGDNDGDEAGAPMGMTPATSPTENSGTQMQGVQQAALLADAASEILAKVGAASELGLVIQDFIRKVSKIAQPGMVSPAAKQNQLDNMQRQNAQNGQQVALLRARQQQQNQPPGGGSPAAAA